MFQLLKKRLAAALLIFVSLSSYGHAQKNEASSLLPVRVDGKWGYINRSGIVVIAPQYEMAAPFSAGLGLVVTDLKVPYLGYISDSGQMAIKPQHWQVYPFSECLAPVESCSEWGFINTKGHVVIFPQFIEVNHFSEGLAAVKISERTEGGQTGEPKWGYVDQNGDVVIPPQFFHARPFSDGLAKVIVGDAENGKIGYIDKTGQFLIKPQYTLGGDFSEGLAAVEVGGRLENNVHKDGKYGYINKAGEFVIKPQFASAMKFSEGLAKVFIGDPWGEGKWVYIDKTGKIAIDVPLADVEGSEECENFSEGLACVAVDEKIGYMDRTGKIVIKPQFDVVTPFSNGIAPVAIGKYEIQEGVSHFVRLGDKWGYIYKNGKYIWPPSK